MSDEIEKVLANWIEEALSPVGQLPPGTSPAQWIAGRFLNWWQNAHEGNIRDTFDYAESALERIVIELNRQGGWDQFGEALHECTHLKGALDGLRLAFDTPKK